MELDCLNCTVRSLECNNDETVFETDLPLSLPQWLRFYLSYVELMFILQENRKIAVNG